MDEFVFPVAALALTFLVIVPAMTLVSRAVLSRRRARVASWSEYGSGSTFALLVAPTVLPLVWLASSALHEIEAGAAIRSCFNNHIDPTSTDTFVLVGLLGFGVLALVARQARRERLESTPTTLHRSHPLAVHLREVASAHPALAGVRIRAVRGSRIPVFTSGVLAPRIFVDACFVRSADEAMLLAALLHERAHIVGRDTLRAFLARVCLSANPLGHLLEPEFERWRQAREACCDGDAVADGGEALALAQSIVRAARFDCAELGPTAIAMLCGHGHHALRLRIMLLMDNPRTTARSVGQLVLVAAVIAGAAAPHVAGLELLSAFHFEVERLLHSFA